MKGACVIMKYILCEQYRLCGFEAGKAPAVINLVNGNIRMLNERQMMLLRMCDGQTDCDVAALIFPAIRDGITDAVKLGWIRAAKEQEQLRPGQAYREVETPCIFSVQWSITGACNANCRHCYVTKHQHTLKDLTTAQAMTVLDRLAEAEVHRISLTGGELLLRKDLPQLLEAMQERNIIVSGFCTNGFLLTGEMLAFFERFGMKPSIQISFDGVGCHDWLRGVEGAERMAIDAMQACREHGIPFTLAMCIHRGNQDKVMDTLRFAVRMGAERIRFSQIGAYGDFSPERGVQTLPIDELYQLYYDVLPEILREKPDLEIEMGGFLMIHGKKQKDYQIVPYIHSCTDLEQNRVCRSVEHSFYLGSDGKLLPCMIVANTSLEKECLSLHEHTLAECMHSPAYLAFVQMHAQSLMEHNPQCRDCKYLSYCGCGCRGASVTGNGTLLGIDEDRCAFFMHGWGEKLEDTLSGISDEKP